MSDYVEAVREQLQTGIVSAQALVLLFRAAEEAEQQNDLQALEETLELPRRVARAADEALEAEAERLIALCEQRLERMQAHPSAGDAHAAEEPAECPGCGRPLPENAVRCRACGYLLL
jgi:DNA repair exonuclease SbcCD ATPase subunit